MNAHATRCDGVELERLVEPEPRGREGLADGRASLVGGVECEQLGWITRPRPSM